MNVALGANGGTIDDYSSVDASGSYPVTGIIDGSYTTGWKSTSLTTPGPRDMPQWVTVNLGQRSGATVDIDTIMVNGDPVLTDTSSSQIQQFQVQISTSSSVSGFTTVVSDTIAKRSGNHYYTIAPQPAVWVRLYVLQSWHGTSTLGPVEGAEMEVYSTSCTPTPTATFTDTPTITPTSTDTPTITDTPTVTNTATNSPTITNTPTVSPTTTDTPTITDTATSTPTGTNSPTVTDTSTVIFTNTPTMTDSPTITDTPTITPTSLPGVTDTPTITPTPTVTATVVPGASSTCGSFDTPCFSYLLFRQFDEMDGALILASLFILAISYFLFPMKGVISLAIVWVTSIVLFVLTGNQTWPYGFMMVAMVFSVPEFIKRLGKPEQGADL
jgi:hypothetical protein